MSALGKDFNNAAVPFKVVDDAGEIVPVFEVQGATLEALQSIDNKTPVLNGGEVPTSDVALYDLVDTLNELVSRLGVLLSARAADGTLRISGTVSTSIATVTTLTTLANQTSLGGYLASATVQQQTNQLVQLANTANVG